MARVNHKDDLTGISLGYLNVTGREKPGYDNWVCLCICGKATVKRGFDIRNRKAKSCGCKSRELISKARTIHGRSLEWNEHYNTYYVWMSMKARCYNKNHKSYDSYGGRGIAVCKKWMDFVSFLEDMGDVPKGMTLDRINNDLDYKPNNCRWASMKEQANNKRSNKLITHKGMTLTLQQWADKTGILRDVIWHRLESGWSIFDSLTTPPKKQKNSRHYNHAPIRQD